jgi:hypothetical protein
MCPMCMFGELHWLEDPVVSDSMVTFLFTEAISACECIAVVKYCYILILTEIKENEHFI